jgi:hypothetical protein
VLPIVFGDRFIARFEPGFNKDSRVLTIKGWWWENSFQPDFKTEIALIRCFKDFYTYLDASEITLSDEIKEDKTLEWIDALGF